MNTQTPQYVGQTSLFAGSNIASHNIQKAGDTLTKYLFPKVFVQNVLAGVSNLQDMSYAIAKQAGWHRSIDEADTGKFCTCIALIHSELSEALEGFRKDLPDEHLPHRKAVEVELADAVIRIMDLAGALGLDVSGAIIEKMAYNTSRQDHKPEARTEAHGKKF